MNLYLIEVEHGATPFEYINQHLVAADDLLSAIGLVLENDKPEPFPPPYNYTVVTLMIPGLEPDPRPKEMPPIEHSVPGLQCYLIGTATEGVHPGLVLSSRAVDSYPDVVEKVHRREAWRWEAQFPRFC